jgi:hypothetical protein
MPQLESYARRGGRRTVGPDLRYEVSVSGLLGGLYYFVSALLLVSDKPLAKKSRIRRRIAIRCDSPPDHDSLGELT